MDRRNFLSKLGILFGGLFTLPNNIFSKPQEQKLTYSFDEIFYRPYEGNQNLIYVKDNSILADKIYATDKVNKNYTSDYYTGIYFPVRDILIELKDEYYEQDFAGIIFYLKNKDKRFWKFISFKSEKIGGKSPMRFILNKEGYMQAEFLSENNY